MYSILFYFKSKCKDRNGKFKVKGETKKLNCKKIENKGLCNDGKSKEGKPLKEVCPEKCRSKNEVCLNLD